MATLCMLVLMAHENRVVLILYTLYCLFLISLLRAFVLILGSLPNKSSMCSVEQVWTYPAFIPKHSA